MNAEQVASVMSMESRATIDENKCTQQLQTKLNVFDIAFHNLEAAQMENPEASKNIKDGRFTFVPFPCGFFVDTLLDAFFFFGRDRSKKFLDVGCGIGTKVILASTIFDAYGIEYDEKYVSLAHALNINRVGKADALTFDRYDEFDFIYYYRPIHDTDKYRALESKIHREMKSGALIAPMHTEYNWHECEDMEVLANKPFPKLYRKK